MKITNDKTGHIYQKVTKNHKNVLSYIQKSTNYHLPKIAYIYIYVIYKLYFVIINRYIDYQSGLWI